VSSGRGLCDGLITCPEESYRLWRVGVCDQETLKTRRLKPTTRLWKIQPQWVVTPGKQTNNCWLVFRSFMVWVSSGTLTAMPEVFVVVPYLSRCMLW
jgi:hypothetical protein